MNDEFAVTELWPVLAYDEMAPTVDHLHRLSQIAGKYTLDQPFEPFWSNVPLVVTPRGFGTRTLRAGDVLFDVEYAVLDDRVDVTASTGRVTLPLAAGSVADFYARFVRAVAPLKIAAPRTTLESEIPGSFHLDTDSQPRPYDAAAARRPVATPRRRDGCRAERARSARAPATTRTQPRSAPSAVRRSVRSCPRCYSWPSPRHPSRALRAEPSHRAVPAALPVG